MAEDLDVEAAPSSVDADNAEDRQDSVVDAELSSVLVDVDSNMTTSVEVVVEEEDVASAGGMTSPRGIVMRLFRSSLSGPSWRKLTSLVWAS